MLTLKLHQPQHPEALKHIIPNCKGCTVTPLPYIQCKSSTLPALPITPEQSTALHRNTPAEGVILSDLTNNNDIALGMDQHFQFVLFVSYSVCIGVQADVLLNPLCSQEQHKCSH